MVLWYGYYIAMIARKVGYPGNLPENAIPPLGKNDDANNLVVTFDHYWRQEPKDNPNIWRVTIKTLWKDILILHLLTFIHSTGKFSLSYMSEKLIYSIRVKEDSTYYYFSYIFVNLIYFFFLH